MVLDELDKSDETKNDPSVENIEPRGDFLSIASPLVKVFNKSCVA